MAIKLKAVERNISFDKNTQKFAYVLKTDLYNKLSSQKVIEEAAVRTGLNKGVINVAWEAIGDVVKAWATEGHSVAVPGLGTIRIGVKAQAVEDVEKVSANLIARRRVIFTPSTDIKKEIAKAGINITCYDKNGKIVKSVTSEDRGEVENPEGDDNGSGIKYTLTLHISPEANCGNVSGAGEYAEGSEVSITATPAAGYEFLTWSDGNTNATRTIQLNADTELTAEFTQA